MMPYRGIDARRAGKGRKCRHRHGSRHLHPRNCHPCRYCHLRRDSHAQTHIGKIYRRNTLGIFARHRRKQIGGESFVAAALRGRFANDMGKGDIAAKPAAAVVIKPAKAKVWRRMHFHSVAKALFLRRAALAVKMVIIHRRPDAARHRQVYAHFGIITPARKGDNRAVDSLFFRPRRKVIVAGERDMLVTQLAAERIAGEIAVFHIFVVGKGV